MQFLGRVLRTKSTQAKISTPGFTPRSSQSLLIMTCGRSRNPSIQSDRRRSAASHTFAGCGTTRRGSALDLTGSQIQMYTGARTHELVYAERANAKIIREYYDHDDFHQSGRPKERPKGQCFVCGGVEERSSPALQVLCWEDIDLWILKDPTDMGGRDCITMTIMLRFHKGHQRFSKPNQFVYRRRPPHPLPCLPYHR